MNEPTPAQQEMIKKLTEFYNVEMAKVFGCDLDITAVLHFAHGSDERCQGAFIATNETDGMAIMANLVRGLKTMEMILGNAAKDMLNDDTRH